MRASQQDGAAGRLRCAAGTARSFLSLHRSRRSVSTRGPLMAASRPRYFFAYLDFFDPATYRANARLLDELAAQRAASAMERAELTDTGRAFGGM